jgi:preprotein translocase subunit SecG
MLVLEIALLVLGVILTVAVLMQHGKSYGLSGTIAGGAETFFGKEKGGRIDQLLSRATTVIGALFVVVCLAAFVLQPGGYSYSSKNLGWAPYLDDAEDKDDASTDNGADTSTNDNQDATAG